MAGRHDKEHQLKMARAYGYQAQVDSLEAQGVGKKPVKKAAAKKTAKKATAKKSTAKKTAKKA